MQKLAPLALAMLFALPSCAALAQSTDRTRAGVEAAEGWLALVDGGQIAQADMAAALKSAVTPAQWATAVQQARAPFGAFKSRKLVSAQFSARLPGAPQGEYVVIQYVTTFANGNATETVTPMREADGSWKVSGYFIKNLSR